MIRQVSRGVHESKNSRGFTLVGVLIAVAIVGMLSIAVVQTIMSSSYASTASHANYDVMVDLQEVKFLLKDPVNCGLNILNIMNDRVNPLPHIKYRQGVTTQKAFLVPSSYKGYELKGLAIDIPQIVGPTPLNAPRWAGLTRLSVNYDVITTTGVRMAVQKKIPLYVEASMGMYTRCSTEPLPPMAANYTPTGPVGRVGQSMVLAFACPPSQYLVGFSARTWGSDPIYAMGGICEDEAHLTRTYLGMAGDINNGVPADHVCLGGGFVTGFSARIGSVWWTGIKTVLLGVMLQCDGGSGAVTFGGGGGTVKNCPSSLSRVPQYYVTVRDTAWADPISSLEMLCSQ